MSDEKTVVAQALSETSVNPSRSSRLLLQYDGGAVGKRFILTSDEIILGRRADRVHVWIDDPSVSREHCRIDFTAQKARVTDLGSLNHTFVNDHQVMQSMELCHLDMLRVGNVRLKYFAHSNADQLLLDRIYQMAVQDRMLEIFRKEYLMEKLDEEFRIAKVMRTNLSLLFFDLDKFKNINDTYGHDAGDFVLKEVCQLVKPTLKDNDTFGRYGGEEFCILKPRATIDEAFAYAEGIRVLIERSVLDYEGTIIPVTLSVGVATLTDLIVAPVDLIKMADGQVYESKRNGRNRVSRPA
jgi:two-component system cell cycle response regulator